MPGRLDADKRIAVVGAGLGGIAFAIGVRRLCQELDLSVPDVQVFERDASAVARTDEGYSLSVRSDSGGLQVRKLH